MPSLKTMFTFLENYKQVLLKYPQFQTLPALFDECDMAVATNYGMYDFPEYEFHNNEYYPVFFIRMIKYLLDFMAKEQSPIQFATTWAFYFEGKRFFEGNRALFTNENIRNPIFNAFVMLEMLGGKRLQLTSKNSENHKFDHFPRIDGIASIHENQSIQIIIWNFDESNINVENKRISLQINDLPFSSDSISLKKYQIDSQNSNAYAKWKELGSPQDPTPEEIELIKKSECLSLIEQGKIDQPPGNSLLLNFDLPGQSVSLIRVEPVL